MNRTISNPVTALINEATRRILVLLALACLALPTGKALAQAPEQTTYETSDAAVAAFTAAFTAADLEAIKPIFGPELAGFASGELVQDKNDLMKVSEAVKKNVRPVTVNPKRVVLYLGPLSWPFPIPIVQNAAGRWYFDTISGREEYLNRRIGRNELATIDSLGALVEAEVEYASEDRDGDGVIEYAQKIFSTEGTKDGLYWPTADGEPPSPLGEIIAAARAEGYVGGAKSYHGYHYVILTKQGAAAVGGAKDYIVDGSMVRGFAAIAYPISWGASGIMTFMVGPDGIVYEKNLGPKTEELAAAITEYNPDKTWKVSE